MTRAVLEGMRVLDLTGPEGWFCGFLLAGFGAEVVRVEGVAAANTTGYSPVNRFAWNRGKLRLDPDPAAPESRERLLVLAGEADFVLESSLAGGPAWGITYEELRPANPSVVLVSISPFGRSGPYSGYAGSDLIAQAAGGHMYLDGPADQPMRLSVDSAYVQAGVQSAIGAMIAHHYRQQTGIGQHVDLSMQEAIAFTLDEHPAGWDILRELHPRRGVGRLASGGQSLLRTVFRCSDGWICSLYYFGLMGEEFDRSIAWLRDRGIDPGAVAGEDFRRKAMDPMGEGVGEEEESRIVALAEQLAAGYTRAELVAECDRRKLYAGEVYSPKELLQDPHLRARNFWTPAEFGDGRQVDVPGAPFILGASPWSTPTQPEAPAGEPWLPRSITPPPAVGSTPASSRRVFEGLRVADFAWVGVGPISSKYLADQGAEVIRIESSKHLDLLRQLPPFATPEPDIDGSGYWANFNSSKLGITLNFQHPRARELALALIDRCDVMTDSYRPGVMERWGLRWEEVHERRPDMIWIRMPMFGLAGPRHKEGGYGNTLQAITGIYHLLGEPGGEPLGAGTAFTDFFATHFAGLALAAALEHRRKTGQGQLIEVPQMDAAMYMLVPELVEVQINGEDPGAMGNAHPEAAPHNAYPCLGEDRHVVIACFTDAHWQALLVEVDSERLSADPRFATLEGRKANEAALDGVIRDWTCGRLAEEVMHRLQRRGVPAAVVASLEDLHKDPQLAHRRHYRYLEHPKMGLRAYDAPAFRLSETPEILSRPAPLLGQHNDYVWRELVGLGDDDMAGLIIEGAFE